MDKQGDTDTHPHVYLRSQSAVSEFFAEERKKRSFGPIGYSVTFTLLFAAQTAAAILAWSDLVFAPNGLILLIEHGSKWYWVPFVLAGFIVFWLYLFDFFMPPNLDDNFRLWETDVFVGRSIFGVACVFVVIGANMMADTYTFIPPLTSKALLPVSCVLLHQLMRPQPPPIPEEAVTSTSIRRRLRLVASVVGQEADTLDFLTGVGVGFFVCSIGSFVCWAISLVRVDKHNGNFTERKNIGMVILHSPLVLGVVCLVYGSLCFVRISIQPLYDKTNKEKMSVTRLARAMKSKFHQGMLEDCRASRFSRMSEISGVSHEETEFEVLEESARQLEVLSLIVKIICTAFVVMAGLAYVCASVLFAGSEITGMILGVTGVLFLSFLSAVYVTFRRVYDELEHSISSAPMLQGLISLAKSDIMQAVATVLLLPAVPLVLFMSVLNQGRRRIAGMQVDEEKSTSYLTPRVQQAVRAVLAWDLVSVLRYVHLGCLGFLVFYVCPVFFKVFCSWLIQVLQPVPFVYLLIFIFILGVFLFLLPPVPGAIIYVFGGTITPDRCPDKWGGFWAGAFINIVVCWVVKLVASAIQQKGIGEALGKNVNIRATVGVHQRSMRCIEKVMKAPGVSLGKIAICVGGPDWPVSVLAGILRVPIAQTTLATMPIIFFVAPFALFGTFLSKVSPTTGDGTVDEQSASWKTWADLMLMVATLLSLLLYAGIAWAIQRVLDDDFEELSVPLEENIELHWRDHIGEEFAKMSKIDWESIPVFLRIVMLTSAAIHAFVVHAFIWFLKNLVGTPEVSTPFADIKLIGNPRDKGVLHIVAVVLLCTSFFVMLAFHMAFQYLMCQNREANSKALDEIKKSEAKWKENWIREVREQRAMKVKDCKVMEQQIEHMRHSQIVDSGVTLLRPKQSVTCSDPIAEEEVNESEGNSLKAPAPLSAAESIVRDQAAQVDQAEENNWVEPVKEQSTAVVDVFLEPTKNTKVGIEETTEDVPMEESPAQSIPHNVLGINLNDLNISLPTDGCERVETR
eukprot:TRINITY_DN17082_c0_g1_i2.p1 TRINITY_DN17082_c0_g1~~TRINITY_DN17082_c0_g1_i2.p1  ORF type:complete len:1023 (-),score=166.88 TRINITY_DN17082_c0_g1_i2:186-3254(-)